MPIKQLVTQWVTLCILSVLFVSTAHGATYYVGPAGNNGNSCTVAQTESTPKLTINAGAGCLAAGDTLLVKSGTYAEIMSNIIPSGTAGNHTIVRSQVQYGAIIQYGSGNQGNLYEGVGAITFVNRSYITFDGFTLDGTGMTRVMHIYYPSIPNNTTNITIQNNLIRYGADNGLMDNSMGMAGGHGSSFHIVRNNIIHDIGTGAVTGQSFYAYGIYSYFRDSLIENNLIYNCSGYGLHFYNTISGDNARNVFKNNRVRNNGIPSGKPGILIDGGPDNKAYGNLVYSNGQGGIQVGGYGAATSNTLLYNNTIYGNGGSGIKLGSQYGGPSGTLITNNILYQNGNNTVEIAGGSGTVQTTNLTSGNPLFVNAAAGNFALQAGSPAIDTGTDTNSVNPTDHTGTAYSLPKEKGAYNYGPTVLPNVLVFTVPPTTTILNAVMAPVTVCVDDTVGTRQTDYSTNISLSIGIDANPTTVLTGGTGGAPTSGCRTFSTLSLDKIGTGYKLQATSGALTELSGFFNSNAVPIAPTLLRLERAP